MQGNLFTIHVDTSTLAANKTGYVALPYACTLIGLSTIGSNAHDATIDLGEPANGDGIFDGKAMGDSKAGANYTFADFNGADAVAGQPYHLDAGDELEYTIDYDGAGGTAIQLGSFTLWFLEG